jgi:MscS family membrane protein
MDFLDKIIFDNTVKSYLYVLAIIFSAGILKKFFSRGIAALLFKLVNKIWKNVKKDNFVDLIVGPIGWFLLVSITVFCIDKLNFPTAFHFKIYGHTSETIVDKIGVGIIIISFTFLMLRFIDFIAFVMEEKAATTSERGDDQLVFFLRDFLKVIVVIISFLFLLKSCFNQPVGTLLTSLSIVGAAIALAAKESLENLIASFIIFFDKPFIIGDNVKVNTVTGKIEHIGLRSTRIRTLEKTLVTVPNKLMVDGVVDNMSMRNKWRAEIKLILSDKTKTSDLKKLMDDINSLLKGEDKNIIKYEAFFADYTKDGIIILVEYFTQPFSKPEFDTVKHNINFRIMELMENFPIELAKTNEENNNKTI